MRRFRGGNIRCTPESMPSPVPSLNVATEQIESRMRYEAHVRELEAEISIEEAINQEVPRMRLDPARALLQHSRI